MQMSDDNSSDLQTPQKVKSSNTCTMPTVEKSVKPKVCIYKDFRYCPLDVGNYIFHVVIRTLGFHGGQQHWHRHSASFRLLGFWG